MKRLLNRLLSAKSGHHTAGLRAAGNLLAVERLGVAGTPAAGRRQRESYRPVCEQLEARQVPSASGTISAVATPDYGPVSYTIGTDRQLYISEGYGGTWQRAVPTVNVKLTQISAGFMERNGVVPVCWGIEQVTNRVWCFRTIESGGPYALATDGTCTQISAGLLGTCYGIAPNKTVWEGSVMNQGHWFQLAQHSELQATQVSASFEYLGAYVIAQSNEVFEVWDHNGYADCHIQATEISAGVGTGQAILNQTTTGVGTTGGGSVTITTTIHSDESLYYLGAADGLIHHWMGAGNDFVAPGQVSYAYKQISAGVDRSGYDEVFVRDLMGFVRKWDDSGFSYTGGRTDEIAAAAGDFVMGTAPTTHTLYEYRGNGQWYYTYGTAIRPGDDYLWFLKK